MTTKTLNEKLAEATNILKEAQAALTQDGKVQRLPKAVGTPIILPPPQTKDEPVHFLGGVRLKTAMSAVVDTELLQALKDWANDNGLPYYEAYERAFSLLLETERTAREPRAVQVNRSAD